IDLVAWRVMASWIPSAPSFAMTSNGDTRLRFPASFRKPDSLPLHSLHPRFDTMNRRSKREITDRNRSRPHFIPAVETVHTDRANPRGDRGYDGFLATGCIRRSGVGKTTGSLGAAGRSRRICVSLGVICFHYLFFL